MLYRLYQLGLLGIKGGLGMVTYLLSLFPNATVAYSLRKLSSTATRSIRVRRNYDDAEKDIGFSGKDLDTTALETFVNGKEIDGDDTPDVAYSLRKVISGYEGSAVRVRRDYDDTEKDIGFDENGDLDTTALETFVNNIPITQTPDLAHSLRKVVSAYGGNCIRVRRSSDNAEQDIGFDDVNLDISALETFVGAGNDGFVTTWYDQSGNGENITNPTTTLQPQIVSSGSVITENGKPALQFDGTDFLFKDNMSVGFSKDIHAFIVARQNNTSREAFYELTDNSTTNRVGLLFSYGSNDYVARMMDSGGGYSKDISVTGSADQHQFTHLMGDTHTLRIDGTQVGTNTSTATTRTANDLIVGRLRSSTTFILNGTMQEVIFYNSDQTVNQVAIENSQDSYWISGGNGYVTNWYDQSGDENNAVQTTTTLQPQIVSSGSVIVKNNKPTIQYDGVDDILTSVNNLGITGNSDRFAFIITQSDTDNTGYTFGGGTAASGKSWSLGIQNTARVHHWGNANYYLWINSDYRSANPSQFTIESVNSRNALRKDGTELGAKNLPLVNIGAAPISIGKASTFGAPSLKGSISEIVIYGTDQTANRIVIETNQSNYWINDTGTTGEGFVTTWYDQSGNGENITNPTTTEQPQIVSSGSVITENNKPALQFDGGDFLYKDNMTTTLSKDIHAFTVGRYDNAGNEAFYELTDNSTTNRIGSLFAYTTTLTARMVDSAGDAVNKDISSSINTNQHQYSHLMGDTHTLWIDGTQVGTNTSTATTRTANDLMLGRLRSSSSYILNGTMQEVIFYNSDQTTNRTDIESNQNNYYI